MKEFEIRNEKELDMLIDRLNYDTLDNLKLKYDFFTYKGIRLGFHKEKGNYPCLNILDDDNNVTHSFSSFQTGIFHFKSKLKELWTSNNKKLEKGYEDYRKALEKEREDEIQGTYYIDNTVGILRILAQVAVEIRDELKIANYMKVKEQK